MLKKNSIWGFNPNETLSEYLSNRIPFEFINARFITSTTTRQALGTTTTLWGNGWKQFSIPWEYDGILSPSNYIGNITLGGEHVTTVKDFYGALYKTFMVNPEHNMTAISENLQNLTSMSFSSYSNPLTISLLSSDICNKGLTTVYDKATINVRKTTLIGAARGVDEIGLWMTLMAICGALLIVFIACLFIFKHIVRTREVSPDTSNLPPSSKLNSSSLKEPGTPSKGVDKVPAKVYGSKPRKVISKNDKSVENRQKYVLS